MQKKHNALFLILGIMGLIITAYSLFITVFNQIISQNEGFFYAIVFGGILILVYVFVNIVVKLMNVSPKIRSGKTLAILCFAAAMFLMILFSIKRLSYSSSVDINETDIFHFATLINNSSVSTSQETVNFLLFHPSYFTISYLYSLLFGFITEIPNFSIIVNVVLSCISAIFLYFTTARLTDGICGIISVFSFLFLPGNMYIVYSSTPECLTAVFFFGALFFITCLINTDKNSEKIIDLIFYSIFMGLLCLNEPVFTIALIFMPLCMFITHRKNSYLVLFSAIISMILTVFMLFYKASVVGLPFYETITSFFKCFIPFKDVDTGAVKKFSELKEIFDQNIGAVQIHIENNFNFLIGRNGQALSQLAAAWLILLNQVMYMFFLILSLSSIFNIIQNKDKRLTPVFLLLFTSALTVFFQTNRSVDTLYYHGLIALISSVGYFYMYLVHHTDDKFVFSKIYNLNIYEEELKLEEEKNNEPSEEEKELERQQFILRANALIFKDENTALYNMIKNEEKSNAVIRPETIDLENEIVETTQTGLYNNDFNNSGDISDAILSDESANKDFIAAPSVEADIVNELPKDIPGTKEMPKISQSVIEDYNMSDVEQQNMTKKTAEKEIKKPSFDQPEKEPVTYIPNPLPVPVRRPHAAMDFDYDTRSNDDDWDFDIKDIHLKDFDI